MKNLKTIVSLLLVFALLAGFAVPVNAADSSLNFAPSTLSPDLNLPDALASEESSAEQYADDEVVRVSIVLEKKSTIDAGFSTKNIVRNRAAMAYRSDLQTAQERVTANIQTQALEGNRLDVVWNLTLAANIISANVEYGQIEKIKKVAGVKDVFVETVFEPAVVDSDMPLEPNMSTSSDMIGSAAAYAAGFTGAGSRIAVIDTGTDTDHQSFRVEGYDYSLGLLAQKAGMTLDAYKASLDLLDVEEIASVLSQLNVAARMPGITAQDLFLNDKLAFGYNYADGNLIIHHDNDSQGSHGSHVAGIAAANAYIPREGGFVNALDTVLVQGVAPDAQLLTMKVFGASGGASESDYMAAIEDAILLGADVVNLSMGSGGMAGFAGNPTYEEILANLAESDTVMVASAGNYDSWPAYSYSGGYLYGDDVNMQTGGSPGSFTNSLAVASVENDGLTGKYLQVGDAMIFYMETPEGTYSNLPISTLAGTHEYIMIDGIGSEEEFAAVADVLAGKIAVCHRGQLSFDLKAEYAVMYGAIATIICNNEPGTFLMDLSSYTQDAPCISVTQADGQVLLNAATPVTDDAGNVLYYRGEMEVSSQVSSIQYGSDYYTMSSFSSWGIPGSLTMKPEITAPGGNIYSIDGVTPGGTAYENMSGTSMSAPQVSGMMALLGQYLKGSKTLKDSGLTQRGLSQSLLMSTAAPLIEEASGSYWSILKQGAGLANVGAAVSAQSYLVMGQDATESWADGKVKAELGDDPARTGTYQYSFTLRNLSGKENSYTLSTNLFTQDLFVYEEQLHMDTMTTGLPAEVVYTVDGQLFQPNVKANADVDKDGDTDADDAQALLDYILGNVEADALDLSVADLNGDDAYTTYDAHLILANRETRAFTVPSNGSVEIQVTIQLPDTVREYLDTYYECGAYVEGYTFLNPVSTQEGAMDVTHSIPVLGFYGNWSEPSMYDKLTYADYLYGDETVPYTGSVETNCLTYRDSADKKLHYQVGNPYTIEETYPADRAAIRSTDTLYQYRYSLIRNAAAMMAVVTDEAGNVLYHTPISAENVSAYYSENSGSWQNASSGAYINKTPASLGVAEGDRICVSLVAVPEYYIADMGNKEAMTQEVLNLLASDTLGSGAFLTTPLVIDDTAPELLGVKKDLVTGNLEVTARDNQYIAYVAALSRSGVVVYDSDVPTQDQAGQTVTSVLDVANAGIGEVSLIFVGDYAGNTAAYTVEYGGELPDYSGKMLAFTSSDLLGSANAWVQIDPETVWFNHTTGEYGGMQIVGGSPVSVAAADFADGYIFFVGTDNVLYVAPVNEPDFVTRITDMDKFGITGVYDMAMNYTDGKLYILDNHNTIWSINPITGDAVKEMTVELTNTTAFLATMMVMTIDDAGNFYGINYGSPGTSYLYCWTKDDAVDGHVAMEPVSETDADVGCWLKYSGSLAWDHDNDVLYLACAYENANNGDYDNVLWQVDTQTGVGTRTNSSGIDYASQLQVCMNGLMVIPSSIGPDPYAPTDQVLKVDISLENLSVLKGAQVTLDAAAFPWYLTNRDLLWSSSDESVATVENGTVVAVAPGEAVITAASVLDPTKTDTCTITVEAIPGIALTAAVYDADSNVTWSEFAADAPEKWAAASETMPNLIAGALYDETVYAHDGSSIYAINPIDFTVTNLGSMASNWLWSDAAPAPKTANGAMGQLIGLCNNGSYLEFFDPETGTLQFMDLSDLFDAPMATIAYVGSGTYYGMPSNNYYMMTEDGALYEVYLFSDSPDGCYLDYAPMGSTGLDLSGVSSVTAGQYASMIYDEATGYLALSVHTEGDTASLYIISPETCLAVNAGSFGSDVWPVVSLYQFDRPTDLTVYLESLPKLFVGTSATAQVEVVLYENDPSVTWASSDTSVATVDENGVITGVGEGTATITATTVEVNDEGEHVTASVIAAVSGKTEVEGGTVFHAQIQTKDGNQWVTVDTTDMSVKVDGASDVFFTGGGAHDGYLYGSDSDFGGMSNFYRIDPADGYSVSMGSVCSADYAMLDLTTAPEFEVKLTGEDGTQFQGAVFGNPAYLSNTHVVYLIMDYVEGSVIGNNALSEYFPNSAAVTYAGLTEVDGTPAECFYLLSTDGTLDLLCVIPEPYTDYYGDVQLDYHYGFQNMGNVGYTFSSHQTLSMTMADMDKDGTPDGLIVADSSAGRADLFYIDTTAEALSCGYFGSIDGATAISSLYVDAEMLSQAEPPKGGTAVTPACKGEEMYLSAMNETAGDGWIAFSAAVSMDEGAEVLTAGDLFSVAQAKRNPTGGLNAAASYHETKRPQAGALSTGTYNEKTGEVKVAITAADISANGRMQVTYDPAELTLIGVADGTAEAMAYRTSEGAVELAYASSEAFSVEAAIAVLTFRVSDGVSDQVELVISQSEINDGLTESGRTVQIPMPHVCPHNFVDVEQDDWFHEAVDQVFQLGLMVGMDDRHFSPNSDMTRAQLVTVIYRLAGSPEATGDDAFLDVKADAWYAEAVAWAAEQGIVKGIGGGQFAPSAKVTRQQLVTIFYRYAAWAELDVSARADLSAYTDADQVHGYALDAMSWAVATGLIRGTAVDTLSPVESAARAQIATILIRFLTAYKAQ